MLLKDAHIPEIKIVIANFEDATADFAEKTQSELGLRKFNSFPFQFQMIPAGEYLVKTDFIFKNQYNIYSPDNPDKVFRCFEWSERLGSNGKELETGKRGYYIKEGIEDIRKLQKRITVCNYCGAPYVDDDREYCDNTACYGSEYLSEPELYLTRLKRLTDSSGTKREDVPPHIRDRWFKAQQKVHSDRQKRRLQDTKDKVKEELRKANLMYKFSKDLINFGLFTLLYNVIQYKPNEFTFGWRESLSDQDKLNLAKFVESNKDKDYKVIIKG